MSTDTAAISFRHTHVTLNQPCSTSISWDDGKEIRMYHLGPGNILQEYAYSSSKDRHNWRHGGLHDLNIVLDPASSLAAIRSPGGDISVYYQDPNDDVIRALFQPTSTTQWYKGWTITTAVKGSSIALVQWFDWKGVGHPRIFYQDPKLCLREYLLDRSKDHWFFGDFNPGVQPRGTPISAETVHGGGVDINVMWRDARGRVISRSWSKLSGWDQPNDGREMLDGRD
jgi:hypothetical protein